MRIRVFIKEHGNSLSIVKIGTQVVANWRFNAWSYRPVVSF